MSSTISPSYDNWTRQELIARLVVLEHPKISSTPANVIAPAKSFNFASHSLRKIALKFCYSGWEYNGLAFQHGPTPLPTVEGVLFSALARTRLVDSEGGLEGCGWERCGRTDRGVSAAGQVVSLYVRSALGGDDTDGNGNMTRHDGGALELGSYSGPQDLDVDDPGFGDVNGASDPAVLHSNAIVPSGNSELRYITLLNRVLPPTIRVLAWSPVSPGFSARFACQHRHYKYFFRSQGLDISRMRDATSRLVGEHDFRNLCKIDATKQITNFHRRILRADINPVSTELVHDNSIHVLDLVGTAFLYHQVRHIMAILFLVGAGLEHPSVMSALVNVDQDHPAVTALDGDPVLEVVDRKPEYEMADALPLTLWDCAYADSDVQWRTDDVQGQSSALTGTALYQQLDSIYARSAIQATLEAHFLAAAAQYHSPPSRLPSQPELAEPIGPKVMSVPLGGGMFRRVAKYIPLLVRKRLDPVDVINRRWIVKKGLRTGKEADAGISNTM